ncbi:AMP-binding protein [soil metagenome]
MNTLLDLLETSAGRFGAKPALLMKPGFRTRRWSYRALADLVPRAGRVFAECGIRPRDRVLIWASNRPEWSIAFFAALHAGAILVPIDARSPAEFAAKVAARTRAGAVIASKLTEEGARSLGLPVHLIEALPDLAKGREPLARPSPAGDDLVEIVFTSGTTGDPRGVMLTHRNILSNALATRVIFPLGPRQRLLSLLPLSHMYEQMAGLFAPLLTGASVAYPSSRQPAVIFRSFRDFRVTMVLLVPQALRLFDNAIERQVDAAGKRAIFERLHRLAPRLPMRLRRLLFRSVHRRLGGRLRFIVSGGAPLDPALGRRWQEMGIDVLQGYGTTECAPAVTFNVLGKQDIATVGVPLPNVEVRIAPDGEVLVRGPNVFPGYWEDEEATRACLKGGWYHTGDLGELDQRGFLTLRGRKKDLIVLPDGTNVYPEDIEDILQRDARVKDAAVVGLKRPGEDIQVHAVLLLEDPGIAAAIVSDANTRLSGPQQIRGHTVWAEDDLPRTHTLKVKKQVLLERIMASEGAPPAEPRSRPPAPAADDVTRLAAKRVKLPPSYVHDGSRLSSDLGLDSLARVELLGVLEEELGAYVDDAALAPDATVADLRRMVEAAREGKHDTGIFGWPLHPLARTFGLLLQEALVGPLVKIFYRVRIRGRENLLGLAGPVLFAPNHCLHWDNGIILTSIPLGWRWKLAVAAVADDIFGNRVQGALSALLAGAFPMARDGAVRRSLELLGARLDRDFSVLIYPEGKLTVGGPMQPFKSGAGLIAVEAATPVVPMRLKIRNMSIADRFGWPLRGDVEVVFGRPLSFAAGTDVSAATDRLEAAVAAL